MNIVLLKGGLGNQIFQFAFGQYLAASNNCETKYIHDSAFYKPSVKHNVLSINKVFDFNFNFAIKDDVKLIHPIFNISIFIKLIAKNPSKFIFFNLINERNFRQIYYHDFLFVGYWHDKEYLSYLPKLSFNKDLLNKIPKKEYGLIQSGSCVIHLRFNDYLGNKIFVNLGLNYYKNAIIEAKKLGIKSFVVFSDNVSLAMSMLNSLKENFFYCHEIDPNLCFYLMYSAKNLIIANSTFSYLAAYLGNGTNVISPKNWFNERTKNSFYINSLYKKTWLKV